MSDGLVGESGPELVTLRATPWHAVPPTLAAILAALGVNPPVPGTDRPPAGFGADPRGWTPEITIAVVPGRGGPAYMLTARDAATGGAVELYGATPSMAGVLAAAACILCGREPPGGFQSLTWAVPNG